MRWLWRASLAALLLVLLATATLQMQKRLPPGVHVRSQWQSIPSAQLRFLRDQTAADARGQPLVEQQIQAALLQMIATARTFVLIDTGLFGDLPAAGPAAAQLRTAPSLATDLAEALLRRKAEQPALRALLVTDPTTPLLNGTQHTIEALRAAGIDVVTVDVARLRVPDAASQALLTLCCRWGGDVNAAGSWPNPAGVGPVSVSFAAWVQLHGFQRSHRQFLIADDGAAHLVGVVFSRPLHAEAGIHTATALQLRGSVLEPLLEAEFVVAQFSGWNDAQALQAQVRRLHQDALIEAVTQNAAADTRVCIATEGALRDALLDAIAATGRGASIELAALYLSERALVTALVDASRRGAAVRVLLDPGKDAYGYARDGFPNRQVATELVAASDGAVRVRWYRTHGEQFSPGLILIRSDGRVRLMVGTAELSRGDLDDYNLAAGMLADAPASAPAAAEALNWFDILWDNRAPSGIEYSADVDVYADASQLHYWRYRLLEASGASFD
jgi:phosphatidylserine/phosphatidylglycerophosphate/cardiolipin synthase-like enzyme